MSRGVLYPALLAVLAFGFAPLAAKNDIVRVTLDVPMPERIDMTGLRRVLVTQLVVEEEQAPFNLGRELVMTIRRDLRLQAGLDVLDVEPPPLPEQPLGDLVANTGFWRRLAQQHEADLIITGETSFRVIDRSGYVSVDEISPLTGQRVRRSRFVNREGFVLDLRLFFLNGSTGQLLYEDHFNGQDTFPGLGHDRLSGVFDLYGQMSDDVRSVVSPRWLRVQRNLFTE